MVKVNLVQGVAQKNLDKALKTLTDKVGKVGWFERSKYATKAQPPVAYIATIQEFGSPQNNIPPRPFMRPTIAAQRSRWAKIAEQGSRAVIKGRASTNQVMELLVDDAAGEVQKTIASVVTPPLAPATIARRLAKKSDTKTIGLIDKPLIDTGLLFDTLIGKVEKE